MAIDTEFLRDTTYWPILCLIQVAAPGGAKAIIDPLAPGLTLKPFLEFLAGPGPVKVFHAARQDLEIFHQLGDIFPDPLYDTQIAAMVCRASASRSATRRWCAKSPRGRSISRRASPIGNAGP